MRFRVLLISLLAMITTITTITGVSGAHAAPPTPTPVYAPTAYEAADPGVATDAGNYYIFHTGGLARTAHATAAQGPWTAGGNALSRWPGWANGTGAVWAPDAWRTSAGWVLYYALIAKGFSGQRCIGTAIADNPAGPYEPSDTPLICPILGGEDPAADRPVAGSGMIDPNPFLDSDGSRYLLYKTQQSPGTIRMVKLSSDGLHTAGEPSHELIRHSDSIENPALVQRGDQYILFASANWYDHCNYATVWRRSTDLWSFADKTEHVLLDQANTGICGPGGADFFGTAGTSGQPGGVINRIILHGWVCGGTTQPCAGGDEQVTDPTKKRVLYAATLSWGADGATPTVPAFLPPGS